MVSIYSSKSFIVKVILLFLFDVLLLQFPLTNILGFEYSFVNGIVLCFFGGMMTIIFCRKNGFYIDKRIFPELSRAYIIFITIPFLISIIASFFIQNCSLLDGIYFYFVLTLPSLIIGVALGFISVFISTKFTKTIFVIIFFLILMIPFAEFYYNPQVYFYNPIFGYYPGTIYDETIRIDWKLIIYRILNLFYFGSISSFLIFNFLKGKRNSRLKKSMILFSCLMMAIIFYFLSSSFGFLSTSGSIKQELGGRLKTRHFEICYDKSISKPRIELIGLLTEYFYENVETALQVRNNETITVFIFKDQGQKKKLMGSANADVAKPWLKQIYIEAGNYNSTLKHEIVHVLAGGFGKTPFKIASNLNPALTEGVASAIDYCSGNYTNHYLAFLALENGYSIPLTKLFSGLSFFGQVSTLSYIYAGSFCKYLIDEFGIEKFKEFYSGTDFEISFGRSLTNVEKTYFEFLKRYSYENNPDAAKLFFARPPIFKKVCARFLSEQIDDGWMLFNKKNFSASKNQFQKLLKYSGTYSALTGYIISLNKLNEYQKGLNILQKEITKYESTSYEFNLKFMLADQFALNDDVINADKLYSYLILSKPGYNFLLAASVRNELLKQPQLLKRYLSEDTIKFSILAELNADTIFYASLPSFISNMNFKDEDKKLVQELIKRLDNSKSIIQTLGILSLAEYCLEHNDFESAKKLLIKAYNFKQDKNIGDVLYSQLKKVNWLCNFSDETKSEFIFQE